MYLEAWHTTHTKWMPVENKICQKSAYQGQYEQDSEKSQGLTGYHGQHHEGLVSGRGNHRGYQGPKADNTV